MLPKLLSLLTTLLSVGELAMEAYVRVRNVFDRRKMVKVTAAEMRRYKLLLPLYPELLTREQQEEVIDIQNRLDYRDIKSL